MQTTSEIPLTRWDRCNLGPSPHFVLWGWLDRKRGIEPNIDIASERMYSYWKIIGEPGIGNWRI